MKKLLFTALTLTALVVALAVVAAFGASFDHSAAPPAVAAQPSALVANLPDPAFALVAASVFVTFCLAANVRGVRSFGAMLKVAFAIAGNACMRWLEALPSPVRMPFALGIDAWTKVSDLWVPQVLQEGMTEPVVERAAFLDSGVVATNEIVTAAASGPGTAIQIPFIVSPNHDDELQVQDTAPAMNKLGSGLQVAAITNRVSTLGGTALAGQLSGVKPGGDLISVLLAEIQSLRKRQRNRTVLAQVQGLFHTASTPAANTGALKALRLDQFLEDGGTPLATNLIDSEMMLDAIALSGENSAYFEKGGVMMHSVIANALLKQDQIDVIRNSDGEIILRVWKGLVVTVSDKLVRDGGTSGKVYTTFIFGKGSIAMGDKPQVVGGIGNPVIDVASLNINADVTKNNAGIYDRTRFILHVQGAKWTGTPADTVGGPTNAEFATYGNWALGAADAKNVRVVCVRTNG